MNIYTAAALLQLLLAVGGSDLPGENKRIGCYYIGMKSERHGTVYPEDIDASICTHLFYLNGAINNETQEIIIEPPSRDMKTGGEGFVPRLAKLKAVNPDLKLILHIIATHNEGIPQAPPGRSNVIQNGIKWLNETGFDGFVISVIASNAEETEKMADFICEMKNEFDKFGYTVMTTITPPLEENLSKIARCSDLIGVNTYYHEMVAHRMAPMSMITHNVDWMIERGVPADKILVLVPDFGMIFTLEDPNDTNMGAAISGPGNDDREMFDGVGIHNKDLLRKMNDSSLGWTIRRDNETKEPYAFSTTGLWTSYEDTTSMEFKARYVLERGLGGIATLGMDYEDDEGIGGEGRFPLTRTAYNTLRGGNQPVNTGN